MAIIKYPNELETAVDAMSDSDIAGFYQPGTTAGVRKQKKNLLSVWKSFFNLAASQRGLISGRFDSAERVSSTLDVTGWYTIAETDAESAIPYVTDFVAIFGNSSIKFHIECIGTVQTKTRVNTTIEIIGKSGVLAASGTVVHSARLAKSDSIAAAGFKVQVLLNVIVAVTMTTLLVNSTADSPSAGFQLVTPVLDNTPTLPDGVTAATFLEAGEELSFESPTFTFYSPEWTGRVVSANSVDCCVLWPEIPKQGTGIVITLPVTNLNFKEGVLNGIISGAHTTSNFVIDGKHVFFRVTETGAFSALTVGINTSVQINGASCKLTIT